MNPLRVIAAVLMSLGMFSPALAGSSGSLDGKTFEVTAGLEGDTQGYADTLVYSGGTFRSVACDEFGFEGAAYRTEKKDAATVFTSTSKSKTDGVAEWRGIVKDGAIEGSFVWIKDGKKATYWLKGSTKG